MDKKQEPSLIECFVRLIKDLNLFCGFYDNSLTKKSKFCPKLQQNSGKKIEEKEMQQK